VVRAPFLLLAVASLLAGLAGGLTRLGFGWVPEPAGSIPHHGALMILGFLSTLIGLERAVALRRGWAYAAPLATGSAGLLLAAGAGPRAAGIVGSLGAAVLVAVMGSALRRQRASWLVVQTLGASCLLGGAAAFAAGVPLPWVVPAWMAFLVLTIAGERLELTRIVPPPRRALQAFGLAVALLIAAALAMPWWPDAAGRATGLAWLALALWLARFDLARRSLGRPGLPRFMASALLSGYVWLGVAGLLALISGWPPAGRVHDAITHAVLLGFVFALVFGHAPVVFPAVLRLPVGWRQRFWIHLGLLHAGVLLRVTADLVGADDLRAWAGLANAAALLLFLVQTVTALERPASS